MSPSYLHMLGIIDNQLFPDECTVLDTGKELVYPIFKNGSSSLHKTYKSVSLDTIKNADCITVYLREPLDRFYSGVNTYLENNKELDKNTAIAFLQKHLFLDRHFCPQFYWIVNLQRFTSAKIKFLDIAELNSVTDFHLNKSEPHNISEYFVSNDKLQFYMSLDKVLYYNMINQVCRLSDVLNCLKQEWPEVYEEVVKRSIDLCNVLD